MEYLDKARKDFLTGCYSKEELYQILDRVKAECNIYKRPFSILVLDLDHFKAYNDKYGHLDGDEVLKYFASTLRLSFDEGECIPVRFGGDEFIIIFPGKGAGETHALANGFAHNLRKRPFLMRGRIFKMHFSGGIAAYPNDGTDTDDLLQKSDKAMYYSKTHGRGKTTHYEGMWLKTLKRSIFLLVIGVLVIGVVYYKLYSERVRVGEAVARVKRGINATLAPEQSAAGKAPKLDRIYLKSGRVFSGRIIRETEYSVELGLELKQGEGSIVLKKSDIKKIEKGVSKEALVEEKK